MSIGISPYLALWAVLAGFKEPAKQPAAPAADVTYTVPAGWERAEKERVVTLTPPGTPAEKCSIVLTPAEPLRGDFDAWFKQRWDSLRNGAKVVHGGERTGQENGPNGSSFYHQAALLESAGENGAPLARRGLLLYAVHVGDVVHWVVFRTNGPKLFNEHKKAVNRFLAGLQFYDTRGEPRRQPAQDGKPVRPRPAEPGSRN
jgi:hypothetical protein